MSAVRRERIAEISLGGLTFAFCRGRAMLWNEQYLEVDDSRLAS
jgi:hypothetical protein